MLVAVAKEIKAQEYRVGLTPAGVRELVAQGHHVLVEHNAGAAISCSDDDYRKAGAEIAANAKEIFQRGELIIKVKEPQPEECRQLRPEQILFTYLHLAPDRQQTDLLLQSGVTAIAYETITDQHGGLPLLAPMSEVAGRMAIQQAALCLEQSRGGRGLLLGGVPGVSPADVLVIGGGVVGLNAARMAAGLGARVTLLDRSLPRLQYIDELYGGRIKTLYSTTEAIEYSLQRSDVVIGAVLIPGAAAPKLVTRDMLKMMPAGAVMVDVAIDQGGCFETSKPTTHEQPVYQVEGIVHYCVANMPGGVPRTSTFALSHATLPFITALANKGLKAALQADPHFAQGLNVHRGQLCYQAVAEAQQRESIEPLQALDLP